MTIFYFHPLSVKYLIYRENILLIQEGFSLKPGKPYRCLKNQIKVSWEMIYVVFFQRENFYFKSYTHWKLESVQFSCSVVSDSLWFRGLQHTRLPCPSPTPRACLDSCPLCWWCQQKYSMLSQSIVHRYILFHYLQVDPHFSNI